MHIYPGLVGWVPPHTASRAGSLCIALRNQSYCDYVVKDIVNDSLGNLVTDLPCARPADSSLLSFWPQAKHGAWCTYLSLTAFSSTRVI